MPTDTTKQAISYVAPHLQELLLLEKRGRNVAEDRLVFVGIANVAESRWCQMKAVLKSRKNEREFFGAYLVDRLRHSRDLGYLSELPEAVEDCLAIGDKITFADIEKLLQRSESRQAGGVMYASAEIRQDPNTGQTVVLYGDESTLEEERQDIVAQYGSDVKFVHDPKLRGKQDQAVHAEQYPTIRWNFEWGPYIVVGVPDGITDELVYEFKSTRDEWLARFVKPVALAQADLYGLFFRRDKKRVQIRTRKTGDMLTFEEAVDQDNALDTLNRFAAADQGGEPQPPKLWKCRSCEFVTECAIAGHVEQRR